MSLLQNVANATTPLRVPATAFPPFVFNASHPLCNGSPCGFVVDLLDDVLERVGWTQGYDIYFPNDTSGGVLDSITGNWTGMVGEVLYNGADITAFPLQNSYNRSNAIHISASFYDSPLGILVQKDHLEPNDPLFFLYPFSWPVWVLLLVAMFAVSFVMAVLSRLSPFGDFRIGKIREVGTSDQTHQFVMETANDNHLVESAMTAFGNAVPPKGRSWGLRTLAIGYMLFSVVVLSVYNANMSAILTIRQLGASITSLQDLLRTGKPIAVLPRGATFSYFSQSEDLSAKRVRQHLAFVRTSDEGVAAVRNGSISAYVTNLPTLAYYAQQPPCALTVTADTFGPSAIGFGMRKGHPLAPLVDEAMRHFQDSGRLDLIRNRWMTLVSQCDSGQAGASSQRLKQSQLQLADVQGLFIMLALLAAFAALWVAGEHVAHMVMKRSAANPWVPNLPRALSRMASRRSFRASGATTWSNASTTLTPGGNGKGTMGTGPFASTCPHPQVVDGELEGCPDMEKGGGLKRDAHPALLSSGRGSHGGRHGADVTSADQREMEYVDKVMANGLATNGQAANGTGHEDGCRQNAGTDASRLPMTASIAMQMSDM